MDGIVVLKIAQVCPYYLPHIGGVENHVKEISKRLVKNNEIEVLTTDPLGTLPKKDLIQGVEVIRFRSFAIGELHPSYGLYKFLKNHSKDYDIVHAHDYNDMLPYYVAKSKTKNKFVFSPHFHGIVGHTFFHSLSHIPWKYFFGRKIFGEADFVICGSKFERYMIRQAFADVEEKLHYIREAPTLHNLQRLRSNRPFDRENKIILCVSRIEKYKGIQHVIEALPHLPSYVVLHIVGKGPYRSHLERLVEHLSLQERVIFSEGLREEELFKCYASADVGVLLSFHEMFGLFIAEALASGMPCVVANRGGLSEWVDGRNCLGVNCPNDIKEVTESIQTVLDGRVANVNLSDWDEYVQKLQGLYALLW